MLCSRPATRVTGSMPGSWRSCYALDCCRRSIMATTAFRRSEPHPSCQGALAHGRMLHLVVSAERWSVIASLFNPFRCTHRRTTFPMTPVRKKAAGGESETPLETYVVCLECGKQFAYDWENMRIGSAVDISDGPRASEPETSKIPFRTKSKLRYLL